MISFLFLCIILLFVILMGLSVLTALLVKVPFVPSSYKSLRALDQITFLGNEHVCDLGSGTGTVLFHLRKKYPHMHLIGYELAILPYLYAQIKNFVCKTHIQFEYKNFLKANLESYDIFFCYLMPGILHKVIHTIQKQRKKKTTLITNTFRIHHLVPEKSIPIQHSTSSIYIYTV